MLLEPIVSNANYNVTEIPALDTVNMLEYIHLKKEEPVFNRVFNHYDVPAKTTESTGSPVLIFSIDNSGVLLLLDGKAAGELSLIPSNLVGRSVHENYPGKNSFIQKISRDITNNHTVSVFENNGHTYKIFYTPLKKQNNNIAGYIGVTMDITSQRKPE